MFLVLLSFVCFFIKFKKVKYGKQRDINRTEIYSKIYWSKSNELYQFRYKYSFSIFTI